MSTSNKDSGYVDNWQAGKTVIDCNLHMLTTEDCSDVIFRVGPEKLIVRAHRYVQVVAGRPEKRVPHATTSIKGLVINEDIVKSTLWSLWEWGSWWLLVIKYMYTDATPLTADTVTGLLYTSRKYAVDALQEMCVTFLEKSLSEDNACQILEHCHGYEEVDLEQKALKILTEAGVDVIKSPGFLELCSNCFGKFLQSDQLNLKEEGVFEAALSWAKGKCKEEGVTSNPENLKKILGELRYEIRFTEFTLEYLVNAVGPSGLLTEFERLRIIDNSVNTNIDISPFKYGRRRENSRVTQRKEIPAHSVCRFSSKFSWPISCSGKPKAMSFTVSRDISIVGCHLNSETVSSVNVVLYYDQDQVIARPLSNTERELRGMEELNDGMFPDHVPLGAGRTYTICVTIPGWDSGKQCVLAVDGVTFTFLRSVCSGSMTHTTDRFVVWHGDNEAVTRGSSDCLLSIQTSFMCFLHN